MLTSILIILFLAVIIGLVLGFSSVQFKVEGDPIIKQAKLSNEEYVMPADSVAILGNGSSDAGAEKLDGFVKYIRKKAFGTTEQQNEINATKELKELV